MTRIRKAIAMATFAFALLEVGTAECLGWGRPRTPHSGRPGVANAVCGFLMARERRDHAKVRD